MKHESLAESPDNATQGSLSVLQLEDAALLDQMLMSCLADTRLSVNVPSPMGECLMRRARPNVLLVGALTDIEAALSALVSDAPIVVRDWTCDAPMPERDRPDVVIIRDVDCVPLILQDAWLSWLTDRPDRPQIIATSCAPVFPLVVAGVFRSDLYYRLNTVLLDLRIGR
jgi:hypothetical protein